MARSGKNGDVQSIDHGFDRIIKQTDLLQKSYVDIGFPDNGDMNDGGTLTVARQAAIHEFGAPESNIPPRPANRMAFDNKLPTLQKKAGGLYDEVVSGRSAKQSLARFGVWYEGVLKISYLKGPFVPLAEATIKARQYKGNRRTRPLVDTKQMVNSITSVVTINEKGKGK